MQDFFEIDFLPVGKEKSGDAIVMRYNSLSGSREDILHIVDGGYDEDGQKIIDHIKKYYKKMKVINHIVITHPDNDHVAGLKHVLNEFEVRNLWMFCPWDYAKDLKEYAKKLKKSDMDKYNRMRDKYNISQEDLVKGLRENFSNLAEIEGIAKRKSIKIKIPVQGEKIGIFTVAYPSREDFIKNLAESNKTEVKKENVATEQRITASSKKLILADETLLEWGDETSLEDKSGPENERSVVQFASLATLNILLTGDVGADGLGKAWNYIKNLNKGNIINIFQVPHHGSRHNLSSEVLDNLFGEKFVEEGDYKDRFLAVISAAKDDDHHPAAVVINAMIHRGGKVFVTNGSSLNYCYNLKRRDGWSTATPENYKKIID